MSKKGRFDKDALPINPRMYKKGTFAGRGGGGVRGGECLSFSLTHTPPKIFRFLCREWKKWYSQVLFSPLSVYGSFYEVWRHKLHKQSIHFLCLAKMWVNTAHFWYIKNKKVRCWIIIYLKTKNHLLNSVHLTTTSIATLPLQPIRRFRRVRIECSHVLPSKIYYHK